MTRIIVTTASLLQNNNDNNIAVNAYWSVVFGFTLRTH